MEKVQNVGTKSAFTLISFAASLQPHHRHYQHRYH